MCNAFRTPSITSFETDVVIAERMMMLSKEQNKRLQKVMVNKWDKKHTIWKRFDEAEIVDFPKLNENELRVLTMTSGKHAYIILTP